MKKLIIDNVSHHYGKVEALNHVSLTIESGEFLAIMGPSGCGKTTLLLIILGALRMDEGHIYLDEKIIDSIPIEGRNIGYVPQDFGLFPHMNVYDNVAFGLKVREPEPLELSMKEALVGTFKALKISLSPFISVP